RRDDECGALRVGVRGLDGPRNHQPLGGPELIGDETLREFRVLQQRPAAGGSTRDRQEEPELHRGAQLPAWRSLKRCSLPVSVRGSCSRNSMGRGYLYGAISFFTK